MTSQPLGMQQSIRFGEDFELDLRPRRLRRGSHTLKLERIPLEILILLLERGGEIVSRDEIVARVWGSNVFLDTDNSIRGAIRKVRQVLNDDPETPRFIQTVTGRGYRFIAPVLSPEKEHSAEPKGEPSTASAHERISKPDSSLQGLNLDLIHQKQEGAAEQLPETEADRGRVIRDARRWLFVGLASLAIVSFLSLLAFWGWRASRVRPVLQRKTD